MVLKSFVMPYAVLWGKLPHQHTLPTIPLIYIPTTLPGVEYRAIAGATDPDSKSNDVFYLIVNSDIVTQDPELFASTPERMWLGQKGCSGQPHSGIVHASCVAETSRDYLKLFSRQSQRLAHMNRHSYYLYSLNNRSGPSRTFLFFPRYSPTYGSADCSLPCEDGLPDLQVRNPAFTP
jgi:hypothetical protein